MPYKSTKQKALFEACAHNPQTVTKAICPPKKVLKEFHEARKDKPKPKAVTYY